VHVVEHEEDLPVGRAEVVDERGDRLARPAGAARQQLEGSGADAGQGTVQRGDDVAPELRRVVVAAVERYPRDRPARARDEVSQQRRLAEARRRGDERQRRLEPLTQPVAQARAVDGPTLRPGGIELGLEQQVAIPPGGGSAGRRPSPAL
jgi:hypothetical protein